MLFFLKKFLCWENGVLQGLEACNKNLHGRLVFNRGDKPYATKDLFQKLSKSWSTTCKWKIISLGRGFYDFQFSNYEDYLKPGFLCLSQWTKDFHQSTHQ